MKGRLGGMPVVVTASLWAGVSVPAHAAPEAQAALVVRHEFGGNTRVAAEFRYLPEQDRRRGGDRVDLQRVAVRTDLKSVTVDAVVLVLDRDSNLVPQWELVPSVTFAGQGMQTALEVTGSVANSRFVGAWDDALATDRQSDGRLALRLVSGKTAQVLLKAGPVTGPFAKTGFSGSRVFPVGWPAAPRCGRVDMTLDAVTGRLLTLSCSR
jgi:hypothetical protein